MLQDVTDDVKKHYFDPLALDSAWDAAVRDARQKIDRARSINEALAYIAAVLDSLNDSHTFFLPPARPYRHDYGFQMEMIGDRCYTVRVRPKSDAEVKGLKAGDEILTIDGYAPTRSDIWRMKNLFWRLRPQVELHLVVRSPDGVERHLQVTADIRRIPAGDDQAGDAIFDSIRQMEDRQDSARPIYAERGDGLLIVKFPVLNLSNSDLATLVRRMRRHCSVILDLRGDSGGTQETLKNLVGSVFERKVKIGDLVDSRSITPLVAEPRRQVFTGKLAVLIDSESASAAELFARVMQLEKRGLVFGDKSAGRAMAAQQFTHQAGMDRVIVYGALVTTAEIRMADGQNLEHIGVLPDQEITPTADDLASGRDPVLAAAAKMLEMNITAEEAGSVFPFRWTEQ